jgi:hypothetical protein
MDEERNKKLVELMFGSSCRPFHGGLVSASSRQQTEVLDSTRLLGWEEEDAETSSA